MPTGVAIPDARARLFDAAERVLLRDGPAALTSRAVTAEAGVAKGVLHRHFADFDDFLAELVLDRIAAIDARAAALRAAAGTGSVVENLAGALTTVLGPVALGILGLVTARDTLLARLRATRPSGMPVLTEATAMAAGYLAAEQERGRIAADADTRTLALMLIGTAHLLFAGAEEPPGAAAVRDVVAAVIGPAAPSGT